jgi:hypothetical protein
VNRWSAVNSGGSGGHRPGCVYPWSECVCRVLPSTPHDRGDHDADHCLACAYGQFYDPDWDSDPYAPDETYGGWSRASREALR